MYDNRQAKAYTSMFVLEGKKTNERVGSRRVCWYRSASVLLFETDGQSLNSKQTIVVQRDEQL